MIDKRSQYLLTYINRVANDRYVVISLNEFCNDIMKNTNYSTDNLNDSIRELSSLGYIRLKYDDGENFCVSSTEKGRSFIDVDEENQKTYVKLFSRYKSVVGLVICSAFFGAFAGSVISSVVIALLRG